MIDLIKTILALCKFHIGSLNYDKRSCNQPLIIILPAEQLSGIIMTICKVGYTLQSRKFCLQFKSATQKGERSPILEEKTDWVAVMRILVSSLDNNPTDTAMACREASVRLEEWAVCQPGGQPLQLRIRVEMKDRKYYRQDQTKCLWLHFSDIYKTAVMFQAKRKTMMMDLRSLAAAAVVGSIARKEDIESLEVPRDVIPDMKAAFDDHWRVKYLNTSPLKRKISEETRNDLRSKTDCPFCGRRNFKKILTHVMRNEKCHVLYKAQLEFNYVVNNCFW